MNATSMARAYSYIRFSSPEQAKGDSLRRQTEASEEYARKHNLVLDESLKYSDIGVSGFTGQNRTKGALAVFLQAVNAGKVPTGSYLLVESFDRLSRDTLSEQITLFMNLINAGITIVTLLDKQIYNKQTIDSNMFSLYYTLGCMSRGHEESLTKSKRLISAWEAKRRTIDSIKLTSNCPLWLQLSEDRKSFLVRKDRVKVIQRIFQLALDGHGQLSIAKILNREKVPTWGKNNGWQPAYIYQILNSGAVIGEFQSRRWFKRGSGKSTKVNDPIKNYYPAVIDMATWQRVQAKKKTTTPGRYGQTRGNLFSRIAFDGYSGSPMRHLARGRNSKLKGIVTEEPYRYYYLVSDYQRLNPGTKAVSWRNDWFEKWFLDYITQLDWQSITRENIPETEMGIEKSLAEAEHKLQTIEKQLANLGEFIANASKGSIPTFVNQAASLEAEKNVAEDTVRKFAKELSMLTVRRSALRESDTKLKDLVTSGDPQARLRLREEIRRRVKRIDMFPSGAEDKHLKGEPVKAPGMPAFKVTFINGAIRWVFCDSRKPEQEAAAILDTGIPPVDTSLELRSRPETLHSEKDKGVKRKTITVPVFVAKSDEDSKTAKTTARSTPLVKKNGRQKSRKAKSTA